MKLKSVLGENPLFEMKATGSIEPIKRELKSLGYDDTFINQLFLHMNQYQEYYRKLCDTELEEEIKKLRVMKEELGNVILNDVKRLSQDAFGEVEYDPFDDVIVVDNEEFAKKKR